MHRRLLNCDDLTNSDVVANAAMNRGRNLAGINSYEKELGFNPADFLQQQLQEHQKVAWLDLCCGSGRALIQGAQLWQRRGLTAPITLVGIDLVPMFDPVPAEYNFLHLEASSLALFLPRQHFDLITCVHGLHYVGDKLGVIQKAAGWLRQDGLFVAHLDYSNLRLDNSKNARVAIGKILRRAGFVYQSRHHRLVRRGNGTISLPYRYLGADDQAGPNYTRQPAVDSYYADV